LASAAWGKKTFVATKRAAIKPVPARRKNEGNLGGIPLTMVNEKYKGARLRIP
jgi:hypothetical protein